MARDYRLTISGLEITPPFRVVFDASKSQSGGLNTLNIGIYNLKEDNRIKLVKDKEQKKYIPVLFEVGYDGRLETVFQGSVLLGENERQGPDYITSLECQDGGEDYLYSFTSKTVKSSPLEALVEDMPNTAIGKITKTTELLRPQVLFGRTSQIIPSLLDDDMTFFIDNERLYVLKQDEYVTAFVPKVSAKTGLLGTPKREASKVTFNSLINPTIRMGGVISLESVTAPHLNGKYRIDSLKYKGDYDGKEWNMTGIGLIV